MTIDFEKTVIQQLALHKYKQPHRAQIYVGFQCHQGCGFCYYHDKCHEKMFDFEQVKKQIDFEYAYGIRDFEITGGEPSESFLLKKICEYIKCKDPASRIAVITNGGLYRSDVWDIIDEVLISYHLGKNDVEYDKNIFPYGNTFDKVRKTADKAKAFNCLLRTNTVLATFNIDRIQYIIDDLIELDPAIVNFLPVNLFDHARDMASYINYSQLRPAVKHAIDVLEAALPDVLIFVRYMPFCGMQGYEQHIVGHLQHIYDWFDWNRELDGIDAIRMSNDCEIELQRLGKYGSTSAANVMQTRKVLYSKSAECLRCKYNILCDGVEKTDHCCLESFIEPVHGTLIKDPLFFIKNATENLYAKLYNDKL